VSRLIQDKPKPWRYSSIFFLVAFILAITLPYLHAHFAAGDKLVFSGFLLNPVDGNTYLAKMYQGWAGEWQFTLPYTAQKGDGAYLFLFYLFLGHLSRWTGLPLVVVFHIARVLGAVFMLAALFAFCRHIFAYDLRSSRKAVLLAAIGSGVGWLALPTGQFTSDFWVAEAYPFLSAYANPHFALGLALLLTLFLFCCREPSIRNSLLLFGLSILLAIIQPFGVVIGLIVIGGKLALDSWDEHRLKWKPMLPVLLGGGIPLLYQYWAILSDPLLSGWNLQNVTPAPPLWDLVLSLSPALPLAIFTIGKSWKAGALKEIRLPVVWLIAGLVLIFVPFNLQRRFMLGIYVPVAILAVSALAHLEGKRSLRTWTALLVVSVLTNIIILAAGIFGATAQDPAIYLTRGEYEALEWIAAETNEDAIILSSPEMGRFIPAYTGRRVVYGHPFETVDAEEQERIVRAFYAGAENENQMAANMQSIGVDYVFVGPREREIGTPHWISGWMPVYQSGDISILKIEDQ
jgi:hypothetical protein